jgi:O-glycosyl hydrolase
MVRCLTRVTALTIVVVLCQDAWAQDRLTITVQPGKTRQEFGGLGVGAIFYEGHITSLAVRNKNERQEQLYDDMFLKAPTRFLQLMIRETHEPENDNNDPYTPAFDDKNFAYCKHTVQIAKAALKRQPEIQFLATLYTPPPWMKTNHDASGGGESRATIKPGMELELAEYCWAFLAHMQKNGVTVRYLSIANEPDWPHTQPGYFLAADKYAALLKTVGDYLDKMAKKYPDVPRPKLVGPNTLSAPAAARDYLPQILKTCPKCLDVVASHDYDPRGDRWGNLRKLADKRPLWVTEWCARKKDESPGMTNSAIEYGAALHEAFLGGANVFMAYDWVYPPRDSGEALIHVKWGDDYALTKPYYVFRQWAETMKPGMKVVEAGFFGRGADGVKATAFAAPDGRTLVIHVLNMLEKDGRIVLKLGGKFASAAGADRTRTSSLEDAAPLAAIKGNSGAFTDTVPARSLTTYRITIAK